MNGVVRVRRPGINTVAWTVGKGWFQPQLCDARLSLLHSYVLTHTHSLSLTLPHIPSHTHTLDVIYIPAPAARLRSSHLASYPDTRGCGVM